MTVTLHPDREALGRAAAELFAGEARRAAEARRPFNVLLSGGETPRRCYELLAGEPLAGKVPWEAVQLFWGDERQVPPDDPRSNFGMVRGALIEPLALSEAQLHPIPFLPTPRESALAYEAALRDYFQGEAPRFDLVFLGLGEDGHTASLLPHSPSLREKERLVCAGGVAGGVARVTVTAALINQAALVAFLVSGTEKAAVLKRVLEGERDPQLLPAQLIHPDPGRLCWLIDRPAASLLSPGTLPP